MTETMLSHLTICFSLKNVSSAILAPRLQTLPKILGKEWQKKIEK